mmetsp:Transcript_819/g.2332  ORF Transcript_819/g.2332 Transcript_819/m.2332 type:complete len:94 (-) Transcript_819:249-530(-)
MVLPWNAKYEQVAHHRYSSGECHPPRPTDRSATSWTGLDIIRLGLLRLSIESEVMVSPTYSLTEAFGMIHNTNDSDDEEGVFDDQINRTQSEA